MSTRLATEKADKVKGGAPAGPGPEGQPQVAPRKRHRWRRRLLITAGLLILLVALLPTLLSTGPGRGLIASLVNRQIRGTVRIDDLSLGWLAQCRAGGVSVLDPQGRQVLAIGQVRWDRGLFKALTGGENYGRLIIDAPQADLYVKPDGTVSLQDALAMRTPSESKPNEKPSRASVAVTWTGARVHAVQPDGRDYVVTEVTGDLTLTSMNEVAGKLTAVLVGGGKLTASASLRDFNNAGRFTLDKATGQAELRTDPAVDLAPLLAFVLNQAGGQGHVTIDVTAKVADGKASCSYTLGAKGLAVPSGGSDPAAVAARAAGGKGGSPSTAPDASRLDRLAGAVAPIDADLKGEVSYQASKLAGNLDLSSKLGTVKANLNYTTGGGAGAAPAVSFQELVSALLAGQSIRLPDFSFDANGQFDLAEASRSIPGLLHLRPDVQITEGSLEFKDLHANGGARPGAAGSLKLAMTPQRIGPGRGAPVPMKPILVDFKLTSDEGGRAHLERADLDSSFATVHAKGDLPELDGTIKADLALFKQQLGEVFDLDNLILAGTVDGTLKGSQGGGADVAAGKTGHERVVKLTVDAQVQGLTVGTIAKPAALAAPSAGQPAGSAQASTSYSGHLGYSGTLRYDPDQSLVAFSGEGSLAKFILSTPNANGQPGREDFDVLGPDKLTVPHDLTYHFKTAALDVKEFKVDSKLISLNVKEGGSITDLTGRVILNLAGDYRLSWPEVTAFLNRFSPKAAESLYLALAGKSAAPITLNGPISNPAIATGGQLAGEAALAGGSAVGWEKGSKAMGMELDPAQIAFSLKDNILRVPKNSVPASGGTLTLAAVVDMTGRDPMAGPDKDKVLAIDGQLQVLDKVGLTEEVGKALLSRALPLLGEVSQLEGKVSLSVKDVHLPLSGRITKVGRGSGHVDLSGVRLKPAGESAHLFKLLGFGSADALPVTISPFDFQLNEGALRFDNLTVTIGGGLDLDLKFRGEVRFDDSVNIVVSVPVRASVLEGLGVVGPVVQYAKALEGVRIEIPIVGSRLKSKLDLAKVDVKPLVAQAIKKIGTSGGGLLPEIIHLPK